MAGLLVDSWASVAEVLRTPTKPITPDTKFRFFLHS